MRPSFGSLSAVLVSAALFASTGSASAVQKKPGGSENFRHSAIVADYDTGAIVFAKDAMQRRPPASLTKMLTLFLVFEALEDGRLAVGQQLTISAHAASMEPSKLGVPAGGTISVEDAILAVVTKSANDMAAALAETLAGSEAAFAQQMTERGGELGMTRSNFRNASGLPHPDHYSTARDMLVLSRAVISRFPAFYRLFSTGAFEYGNMRYPNMNSFLRTYAGADGIKTGYTRAAGHCLAASAVRNGRRIVGVVLGGPSLAWTRSRMTLLVDAAFDGTPTAPGPDIRVASKPKTQAAPPKPARAPAIASATTAPQEPQRPARHSPPKPQAPRRSRIANLGTPKPSAVSDPGALVAPQSAPERPQPPAKAAPNLVPPAAKNKVAAPSSSPQLALAHASGSSPTMGIRASQASNGPLILSARGGVPTPGKWMVRIGERSEMGAARRRADSVRALLPETMQGVKIQLTPESSIVEIAAIDLDQTAAKSVCAQLQRAAVPCIVVAPGREVYVTSR